MRRESTSSEVEQLDDNKLDELLREERRGTLYPRMHAGWLKRCATKQ